MGSRLDPCPSCGRLKAATAVGCGTCYAARRRREADARQQQPPTTEQIERFWSHADRHAGPEGCWPWMGARKRDGYGNVGWRRRSAAPHRVAYELTHGSIPAGLEIDHLCHNRACVNPSHLEPVTHAENSRRSRRVTSPTCSNGHLRTMHTRVIHTPDGRRLRRCRMCQITNKRQRYALRRIAA